MYERAVTDNHVLLVILSTLLKYTYCSARTQTSRAFFSILCGGGTSSNVLDPCQESDFQKEGGEASSTSLTYAFLLPVADEEEEEEEGKADAASALGNKDIFQTWDRQRPPIF